MSKLFGFAGSDDFFPGSSIYENPKEAGRFLSLGRHVDFYYPPSKRSRGNATFVFNRESFEQNKQVSIDVLPEECLFEIIKRLPGGEERTACASVSKKWLSLLSNTNMDEFCNNSQDETAVDQESYLSRSLEGKKATDVRLAAISVGSTCRGGLSKLIIRGTNSARPVTNFGLKAVSHGCPSLRVLSISNVSSVGDEGLCEIAKRCHLLEKLELSQCSAVSDKGLAAIARSCPNLTNLALESCSHIGNEGLQAIGKCCPKLKSVSIKNCPLVGDQGIASLVSSATNFLEKVKLQSLAITDVCLAVIGGFGKSISELVLANLPNVCERGFWVMGNGHGLQKLKSLTITSCQGATDTGLEAVAKGCPSLKQFYLRKCLYLSDNGLVSFCKAAKSLESLHLEECHRITQYGFFGTLSNTGTKLKALAFVYCLGLKDLNFGLPAVSPCESLRSLTVCNCPGFGNSGMAVLGQLCPQLQHVDFSGLEGITDAGFLKLINSTEAGLVKVNLSGCVNLTDKAVSVMAELHGWTLEVVNLEGCRMITDSGVVAIGENCPLLSELDISKSAVTYFGIASLAHAGQLNLQILSLSGCSYVTDKSLPALVKMGETLLGLNLQQCNAISSSGLDRLVKQLWRCDILS